MSPAAFDVVVVTNGRYLHHDQWPPLAVQAAATTLVETLESCGGAERPPRCADPSAADARTALSDWTQGPPAPGTVVYWAGHGTSDAGGHWLVTHDSTGAPDAAVAVRTRELADVLLTDWHRRAGIGGAWTVVVLDCCKAGQGVRELTHALSGLGTGEPCRLALVAACADGASFSGRFAEEAAREVGRLTENDEPSVVRFFDDVALAVGGDLRVFRFHGDDAHMANPRANGGVLTMGLDALAELRAALAALPAEQAQEVRAHFVAKAQGAELNESGWYFRGREDQSRRLVRWLDKALGGMLVVTGEAGAGKSALLGHLVVLADPGLSRALAGAGLLGPERSGQGPAPGAFDVVVHLTGKTLADCVRRVGQAVPDFEGRLTGDVEELLSAVQGRGLTGPRQSSGGYFTVLVDALDEAQQPHVIAASLLRRLARLPGVRVVVGTRGSLAEGPDLPVPLDEGLLDSLGPAERVVVDHDPKAVHSYVEARLGAAPSSPFSAGPRRRATADLIAARDQPFLFARLAVTELLARPELAGDDGGIDELLAHGHRGLFAAAVERLSRRSSTTVALLRSLAFGLGRGLPRTGGVWATVCSAVSGHAAPDPAAIDAALDEAAAFVILDGEDAQSTYRLAHQTFAEHFWAERAAGPTDVASAHAAIARALVALAEERGGWAMANPYLLRRLSAHAGRGGVLAELLEDPQATDHLKVPELRAAVLETFFGRDRIPAPALAVLREADALAALEPGSRGGLRALVALIDRPGEAPSAVSPGAVVRPVWATGTPSSPNLSLRGHALKVCAVAVGTLADGRTVVASGGDDRSVRLWDPATGAALGPPLEGHRAVVYAVAVGVLADGRTVVASGGSDGTVRLWDPATGAALGPPLESHPAMVYAVAVGVLADGRTVVASGGSDGTVRLWDPATGAALGPPLEGHRDSVRAVAVGALADGRTVVASGGSDGTVRLWDPATGAALGPPLESHPTMVYAVAVGVLADGRTVVASGGDDRSVRLWDPATGAALGPPLEGHRAVVYAVAVGVLADGRTVVASGGSDGTVRLWDPATGAALGPPLEGHRDSVRAVAVGALADGRAVLASGGSDGTVRLWDPATGAAGGPPREGHRGGVTGVTAVAVGVLADGRGVVAGDDGTVRLWDLATGADLRLPLEGNRRVYGFTGSVHAAVAVGALANGRTVVVNVGRDGTMRLWDPATGAAVSPPLEGHRHGLYAVAVGALADGRTVVVSGGRDGVVRLWDPATGAAVGPPMEGHRGGVYAVAVGALADGRTVVASGGRDGTVRLWDPATGAAMGAPLEGHRGVLQAVAVGALANGRTVVVSGGGDGTVRLWDPATGAALGLPLNGHRDSVQAVAVGALANGRTVVASGGRDGTVRLWDPATGAAINVLPVLSSVSGLALHARMLAVSTATDVIVLELGPHVEA